MKWTLVFLVVLLSLSLLVSCNEDESDSPSGPGENQPPSEPSSPSPSDEGIVDPDDVMLSWFATDPENDALTFDVYFGTDSTPDTSELVSSDQSGAAYDPGTLNPETIYYWQIVAKDDQGNSTDGPVWSFTTAGTLNQPPSAPSDPSPQDGASDLVVYGVTLSWFSSDPDDDPLTYEVYFGTNSSPNLSDLQGTVALTSWDVESNYGLLNGTTTYYWKIVVDDGHGHEVESPVWMFTTTWDPGIPPSNPSHGQQWTAYLGPDRIQADMIFIEGGTFMMGAQDGEESAAIDEYPRHEVTISRGFWVGKYEATQEQWEAVMGDWEFAFDGNPMNPAEQVSHNDITNNFLPEINEKRPGNPWRLPTEAEWEYACRSGYDATRFWWGDDPDYTNIDYHAWHFYNGDYTTHSVGQKIPNPWGLYDMHGNVWEWCSDWYLEDYYDNSPAVDPQGPANGTGRVLRGASWNNNPLRCRSATRGSFTPETGFGHFGFRMVRESSNP